MRLNVVPAFFRSRRRQLIANTGNAAYLASSGKPTGSLDATAVATWRTDHPVGWSASDRGHAGADNPLYGERALAQAEALLTRLSLIAIMEPPMIGVMEPV